MQPWFLPPTRDVSLSLTARNNGPRAYARVTAPRHLAVDVSENDHKVVRLLVTTGTGTSVDESVRT